MSDEYTWVGHFTGKEPEWLKRFIRSGTLRFFKSGFCINTSREWQTGNIGDSILFKGSKLIISRP